MTTQSPLISEHTIRQGRTVDGRSVHDLVIVQVEDVKAWRGMIFQGRGDYTGAEWALDGRCTGLRGMAVAEHDYGAANDLVMVEPAIEPPVRPFVADVDVVLGLAESFAEHWETDDGQSEQEQAEADEARAVLDRTRPRIEALAALFAGGPDVRPLLDVLGDAESALARCAEQLDQLQRYARPTFDDDEDVNSAMRDAIEADDAVGRIIKRLEALGALPPAEPPTDELFPGTGWTMADQMVAQAHGWELSEFGDGQICIFAVEAADGEHERIVWTGERANLDADAHVNETAAALQPGQESDYPGLCSRAVYITQATIPETEDEGDDQ